MPNTKPPLLLVAAEADFLAAEARRLTRHFTTLRAKPGAPALQCFCEVYSACVVIDATLPGLNGADQLAERDDTSEGAGGSPLLLLTELDADETQVLVLVLGEERCIPLPCPHGGLPSCMQRLIRAVEQAAQR